MAGEGPGSSAPRSAVGSLLHAASTTQHASLPACLLIEAFPAGQDRLVPLDWELHVRGNPQVVHLALDVIEALAVPELVHRRIALDEFVDVDVIAGGAE